MERDPYVKTPIHVLIDCLAGSVGLYNACRAAYCYRAAAQCNAAASYRYGHSDSTHGYTCPTYPNASQTRQTECPRVSTRCHSPS